MPRHRPYIQLTLSPAALAHLAALAERHGAGQRDRSAVVEALLTCERDGLVRGLRSRVQNTAAAARSREPKFDLTHQNKC